MKHHNSKRAFTIVELVIVIAVIAILAAVLIPTFSGIIQKANVSKDTQLIRNLNMALVTDKATGNSHPTMFDALQAAEAAGYDVDKINASAVDNEILWDSANDCFCYFESGKIVYIPEATTITEELVDADGALKNEADAYKFWRIYDEKPSEQKYSIYASNKWTEANVTVSVGFDAGKKTDITTITYANETAQTVVIRTNGGDLTINAKADTVYHYNNASSVNIQAVNTSSYHEYGNVGFIEIAGGNLVIEETANVSDIHFDATNGNFENSASQKISVDLSKVSADMMPNFSRDPVTIDQTNGTLVAKVTTSEENYIWLTKSGVIERITLSTSDTIAGEVYATKTDANYDIADQIANNAKRNDEGKLVDNEDNIIDVTADDWDSKVVKVTEPSKEEVKAGLVFSGGKGTQSRPYLIATAEQLMCINNHVFEGSYFELINDIDISTIDWLPLGKAAYVYNEGGWAKELDKTASQNFKGTVNGNGYTVKIKIDDAIYNRIKAEVDYTNTTIALFPYIEDSYIHDLVVEADIKTTIADVGVAGLCGTSLKSVIENVTVNGTIQGEIRASGFVEILFASSIKNCTNNADITVKHTSGTKYPFLAGFAQQPVAYSDGSCEFINCKNNGDLRYIYASGDYKTISIGAIYSQGEQEDGKKIIIQDCSNTGIIQGTNNGSVNGAERYEGVNKDNQPSYTTTPNKYKILVGGYTTGGTPEIIENGTTVDFESNLVLQSTSSPDKDGKVNKSYTNDLGEKTVTIDKDDNVTGIMFYFKNGK